MDARQSRSKGQHTAPEDDEAGADPAARPAPFRRWGRGFTSINTLLTGGPAVVAFAIVYVASWGPLAYLIIPLATAAFPRALLAALPLAGRARYSRVANRLQWLYRTNRHPRWVRVCVLTPLALIDLLLVTLVVRKDATGGVLLLACCASITATLAYSAWQFTPRKKGWPKALLGSAAGFMLGICGNIAASVGDRHLLAQQVDAAGARLVGETDVFLGKLNTLINKADEVATAVKGVQDDTKRLADDADKRRAAELAREERAKQEATVAQLRPLVLEALMNKRASAFRPYRRQQPRALAVGPDQKAALEATGDLVLQAELAIVEGRTDDARAAIKKFRDKPGHRVADIHRLEGEIAFFDGRYRDSHMAFDRACALDPADRAAQLGRAWALANFSRRAISQDAVLVAAEDALSRCGGDPVALGHAAHVTGVLLAKARHHFGFSLRGVRAPGQPNRGGSSDPDVDFGYTDPGFFLGHAIRVLNQQSFPEEWASANLHWALNPSDLPDLPIPDWQEAAPRAEDSLRVYDRDRYPIEYAYAHLAAARALLGEQTAGLQADEAARIAAHLDAVDALSDHASARAVFEREDRDLFAHVSTSSKELRERLQTAQQPSPPPVERWRSRGR